MRAFSNYLGVSHGYVRNILRGNRPASEKLILETCQKFDMNENDVSAFITQCRKEEPNSSFTLASETIAKSMKSWVTGVVFSCYKFVEGDEPEEWIAKKLGISPGEVLEHARELIQAGILEETEEGKIQVSEQFKKIKLPVANTLNEDPFYSFYKSLVSKLAELEGEGFLQTVVFSAPHNRENLEMTSQASMNNLITKLKSHSPSSERELVPHIGALIIKPLNGEVEN
jgi:transcriptional regulator with XRE-family HTH domain